MIKPNTATQRRFLIVTGLSGAGKSSALNVLEDLGYDVVDNLPLRLMAGLVLAGAQSPAPLAVGVDSRTQGFTAEAFVEAVDHLAQRGDLSVELVFLDCDQEVLGRRFTETRRRHPLAIDRPVSDGILRERRLMGPVRGRADYVIDSSRLSVTELRRLVEGHFALEERDRLRVFVNSFAFREGLPREADLVIDVRFLANPHYVERLRSKTGRDPEVVAYIENDPDFAGFFDRLCAMLEPLLPRYADEGKRYLTIAIGCTGGRHRSVAVAEMLGRRLQELEYAVDIAHRDG